MRKIDVLIVGAGPTGLVLALWLTRAATLFRGDYLFVLGVAVLDDDADLVFCSVIASIGQRHLYSPAGDKTRSIRLENLRQNIRTVTQRLRSLDNFPPSTL
jgi:2-polyprenyl-6-methoxyphenol hydroxylase-like FAD-dependent oxidoreductase